MKEKRSSLIPGMLLIVFGLWMISDRFGLDDSLYDYYPVLILAFASLLLYQAFRNKSSSAIFWGISLAVIGCFLAARNLNLIMYLYPDEYWPIFPLAFGLGFVGKFIIDTQKWGVLIPGAVLIMVGLSSAIDSLGIWDIDLDNIWEYFWPILIIVIGIGILINSYKKSKNNEIE
ncbi:hypothetical protein KAR48_04550 [bacterium]|nr:hypothetical protein [bacterium]